MHGNTDWMVPSPVIVRGVKQEQCSLTAVGFQCLLVNLFYTGHLIMLAGFTSNGTPIVHDPAKSNGYSYVFNKSDLSHSWFDKGGVAYTFYKPDSVTAILEDENEIANAVNDFQLYQNYPNPFQPKYEN